AAELEPVLVEVRAALDGGPLPPPVRPADATDPARLYAACRCAEIAVEHALRVEGPRFGSAETAPALGAVVELCRAACAASMGAAPDPSREASRLTAGLVVLEQQAEQAYGRLSSLYPGEM